MVQRYDYGSIRGAVRTPQGGLRVPAAVTRTGVLVYQRADGSTVRELRLPSEVFAADSMATLRGAPVTDLHPSAMVTAESWRSVSVGHVGDSVAQEGDLLVADLIVQDATEVARIDAKERVEVSCGYSCDTEQTPGVYEGQAYDQIQRKIRYNHVGLGPQGWGRAGPEVSLRMDDARQVQADSTAQGYTLKSIRIGGREYRLDSPEEAQQAQAAADAASKKDADAAAEITALKATIAAAQARIAELEKASPTEAQVSDAVADSLVAKRLTLHSDAKVVLGDCDLSGKKREEIYRLVIEKALPGARVDGLSPTTLAEMFAATVASHRGRNDALGALNTAANNALSRADGEDYTVSMRNRYTNAWKEPQ